MATAGFLLEAKQYKHVQTLHTQNLAAAEKPRDAPEVSTYAQKGHVKARISLFLRHIAFPR